MISPASPADVPAAAEVLAEAFQSDTVISTIIGPGAGRHRRTASLFRALMRSGALVTGRIDIARAENRKIVLGAAVWESPGVHTSFFAQARQLPEFIRALGWDGLFRAGEVQRVLEKHRPVEPHWYLAQIGVSTQARGMGLGSQLLGARLASIDAARMPVYLESSNERNRALYRRHGFTAIVNIADVPGISPAGMWRAAA